MGVERRVVKALPIVVGEIRAKEKWESRVVVGRPAKNSRRVGDLSPLGDVPRRRWIAQIRGRALLGTLMKVVVKNSEMVLKY